MTNMEALDMPAASGVPTTAIMIGDYSNGNDALLVRNGLQLKDLPGKKLLLVQKTVSEYLFDRAMTMNGMRDQIKQRAADQYFRFRYRHRVHQRRQRVGGGDLEAAGLADREAEGHDVAVQLVADSGRDSGSDGGSDRRSEPAGRSGQRSRRRWRAPGTR